MRQIIAVVAICSLVFSLLANAAELLPKKQNQVLAPGTGVRGVLPPGMAAGPMGTYFTDEFGEVVIQLAAGPAAFNAENTIYRKVFPAVPEQFDNGKITGRLYHRTRAKDGGKWDGWWLPVIRGETILYVTITYTGSSNEKFQQLKAFFSDLEWNEREIDPEIAFGAHFSLPHLRRNTSNGFGALDFSESGKPGDSNASLMIQTIPVSPKQAQTLMPAMCAPAFASVFQNQFGKRAYSGPHIYRINDIVACDAWSIEKTESMNYLMALLLPNGALLNVIGTYAPDRFPSNVDQLREAILNLQLASPLSKNANKNILPK